ncbi:uncharacterized protein ACRADG_008288 [Cochliomyia hominivorax]
MCVVIDLDIVCLICLQPNKEMHPIFGTDSDNSELQIAQKISILSELKIDQHNCTLPSKICSKCLQDLKAAWRFRKNCQAAVTIFQTIVKLRDVQPRTEVEEDECAASKQLEKQQIKVPQGLHIKRVNKVNLQEKNAKAEEMLMHDKDTEEDDDFSQKSEKMDSTLYEELVSNDLMESENNESNQFNNIEEETMETNEVQIQERDEFDNVENEDEENTVVEYYITDDGLINETNIKEDIKINSIEKEQQTHSNTKKSNLQLENRQTKLTEHFVKPVQQTTGRSRRTIIVTEKQTEKVQQTIKQLETDNENKAKPLVKPEVRPVKTRKRKSLSPDAKPPKICEICGNSYRFQHALNAHMRRHYNEKPFPCDFCDKAFVSNVELRRHMRVHTGQKPYACQYCDRRFSDFGSRIKHERTHTGERPYHCNTCGKSFAYPHVLSVHLRTHTGEKRFRCQYCSKGFTKKIYLNSHVEQHHSVVSNNFQVVIEDSTDNSQSNQTEESSAKKSQTFSECIYTTEFVNDDDTVEEEYENEEDEDYQESSEIITLQPKMEDEDDIQEIVEVQPDEYTITVR